MAVKMKKVKVKTPPKAKVIKKPHLKKKPKLGTGERFKAMVGNLMQEGHKKDDAKAIAAAAGRKKYGKKKMAAMAAKGKKKY